MGKAPSKATTVVYLRYGGTIMNVFAVSGIVSAIVGLIMLLSPEGFISALVVSLGVASFASGVFTLLQFRKAVDEQAFRISLTIRAFAGMAVGITAIFLPIVVAGTVWIALSYLVASYLTISALVGFYGTYRLKVAQVPYLPYLYESVISLAAALILFIFPGTTGIVLVRIGGAMITLLGVLLFLKGFGILGKKTGSQ